MKSRRVIMVLALAMALASIARDATPLDVEAQSDSPKWVQIKTAQLPPSGISQMVYDSDKQRIIALGYTQTGLEVWEYNSTNWSKKSNVVGFNSLASGGNMVYDSAHKRIVLFGIQDTSDPDYNKWKLLGETWEYNGSTWQKKVTPVSPPIRQDYSMAYDSSRGRVLLFGGYIYQTNEKQVFFNDTWEYDGSNWAQRSTSTSPSPRHGASIAYDSTRKRIVLFGGAGGSDSFSSKLQDTWEYDGANWTQKGTQVSPSARCAASMTFDSDRATTVLFGGGCQNPSLNDTWEYEGTNWKQVTPAGSPAHRAGAGFVYDIIHHKVVMSGGGFLCPTEEACMQEPLFTASGSSASADLINSPASTNSLSATDRLLHSGLRYSVSSKVHSYVANFGGGGPRRDTWEYVPPSGGPKGPQLAITKMEVSPSSPITFQPVDVKLTIENKGTSAYAPLWPYSGRLTLSGSNNTRQIDFDDGHSSVLLLDNPKDPLRVEQKWVLTIHASFWDTVSNGRMQINVQPQSIGGQPGIPPLQVAQTVSVGENPSAWVKCSTAIVKTFALALPADAKGASCVLNGYASAGTAATCKDGPCQAKGVVEGAAKCGIPGYSIVKAIKVLLDSSKPGSELEQRAKDCFQPVQWVSDLVRSFIGRGISINLFGMHSPANLLITNQAGQRAGILDDGSVVQEIPGSLVVIEGSEKYVLYEGTGSVTVRLKGTGTGTMRAEMITSAGQDSGRSVVYDAVPVNPNLIAQVVSSDSQATLSIDNNGDGQADQTKKPDSMAAISPTGSTFAQTGKTVSGKFWTAWQGDHSYEDSQYINGLPLTDKRPEVNPTDGKTYDTQWFERARFEYHPENQPPNDVLLGLMGVRAAQGRQSEAPFKQVPDPENGLNWFKETGHTLGDTNEGGQAIALFWRRLGGLAQFGFPLSQPFIETNKENGKQYLVQYFERQRFEYHPENKGTQYEVLLGRLGAEQINNKQPSSSSPTANIPQPTVTATTPPTNTEVERSTRSPKVPTPVPTNHMPPPVPTTARISTVP